MSLLTQALLGREVRGLGPESYTGDWGGGGLRGGRQVSAADAFRMLTVRACIDLIASTIGSMPIRIVRRGDRSRREVRTPEFQHIWGRPNPMTTRAAFWTSNLVGLLAWGNSYTFKGTEGRATQLWNVRPNRVKMLQASDLSKVFIVDENKDEPYTTAEIMHVPALSTDGFKGLSPIADAARAIGVALDAEEGASRFFRDGLTMNGVLQTDQKLEESQADALKARWKEKVKSGVSGIGDIAILDAGAKFERIGIPPNEAQFLETRQFQDRQIVVLYRVPGTLIGMIDKPSTWGTGIEQLTIGFVVYTLTPWITAIESAINDELLPAELEAKFVVNALLRGDSKTRAEFYAKLRQLGIFSADQILELEDLPPRGIPDDYLLPRNMEAIPAPRQGSRELDASLATDLVQLLQMSTNRDQPRLTIANCPDCGKKLQENHPADVELFCSRCKKSVLPIDKLHKQLINSA